jgi:hypothetical protein
MSNLLTGGGIQTPTEWFVATLQLIRVNAGWDVPAAIVSDGRPEELADILTLPAVRYADIGSALGSIWLMSRARLLIGSGGSTFSLWAVFLGQMPAAFPPGQDPGYYKLANASGRYLGTFDPWRPDQEVTAELADAIR